MKFIFSLTLLSNMINCTHTDTSVRNDGIFSGKIESDLINSEAKIEPIKAIKKLTRIKYIEHENEVIFSFSVFPMLKSTVDSKNINSLDILNSHNCFAFNINAKDTFKNRLMIDIENWELKIKIKDGKWKNFYSQKEIGKFHETKSYDGIISFKTLCFGKFDYSDNFSVSAENIITKDKYIFTWN